MTAEVEFVDQIMQAVREKRYHAAAGLAKMYHDNAPTPEEKEQAAHVHKLIVEIDGTVDVVRFMSAWTELHRLARGMT